VQWKEGAVVVWIERAVWRVNVSTALTDNDRRTLPAGTILSGERTMKIAIYARVSTDKQDNANQLDRWISYGSL